MGKEIRLKHVGADSIFAERKKLLGLYDAAKDQTSDDHVKVDHGNLGEEMFRNFLARFLPQKYGVAKGHILTRDLTYDEPILEWDIIIYNALESPVLYIRDDTGSTEKMGIPANYVQGVVEVKAKLNNTHAKDAVNKLLKLERFIDHGDAHRDYSSQQSEFADFLPTDFYRLVVFFETDTENANKHKNCLNHFCRRLPNNNIQRTNALILRSENHPASSGTIGHYESKLPIAATHVGLHGSVDVGDCTKFETDRPGEIRYVAPGSIFSKNAFSKAMMDIVERLNDGPRHGRRHGSSTDLLGFGIDFGSDCHPLWPT